MSALPKLDRNRMKISDHQLGTKFRSKQDLYLYMTEVLHLYLPPKESINKDFIRQVLKEEKQVLPMEEVKFIKVPRYAELSIKNLLQEAMDDEKLRTYFPDSSFKNKPVPREFFFNIINTIYPDYVKEIIASAQIHRSKPELNEEKKEYILISDSWYDKLMSQPFISSKNVILSQLITEKPGKTIQLLKESTKMLKSRKQRNTPEVSVSLKRFKGMDNNSNVYIQNKENLDNEILSDDYGEQESNEYTQQVIKKNVFNI